MKPAKLTIGFALLALLSACNSADLGVGGATTPATAPQTTGAQDLTFPNVPAPTPATNPATVTSAPAGTQIAAAGTVKMRFAPIIGAPVDKVTLLSRRISARAKEQNITIVASADLTATHVLKGYFSIDQEGAAGTIFYVFDVLDQGGNRLHRIEGQEPITITAGADSWASVQPTTMESIADKAMADFKLWQASAK